MENKSIYYCRSFKNTKFNNIPCIVVFTDNHEEKGIIYCYSKEEQKFELKCDSGTYAFQYFFKSFPWDCDRLTMKDSNFYKLYLYEEDDNCMTSKWYITNTIKEIKTEIDLFDDRENL